MTVDAHHHYWKYDPDEYGWISDRMARLRRDFLPGDRPEGMDRAITVQARQSLAETEWLLEIADAVVGWVPLAEANVRAHLERLSADPRLKGVRHVVQDEPDDQFLLCPKFNDGVAMLRDFGLVYDILIYERQLPAAIEFVDRHPNQIFVLDHVAKPRIRDGILSPWRENIRALAERPNVYCKMSGMVTEADWDRWTIQDLAPYFDTVLEAFGPKRLMFGSDWPVLLVAAEYGRWIDTVRQTIAGLTGSEQTRIWGETAAEAYRL